MRFHDRFCGGNESEVAIRGLNLLQFAASSLVFVDGDIVFWEARALAAFDVFFDPVGQGWGEGAALGAVAGRLYAFA